MVHYVHLSKTILINKTTIMEIRIGFNMDFPEEIRKIHAIFKKEGFDLFLIGGCVRDAFLGTKPKDFYLVTNAVPDKVIELLKNENFVTNILETGKAFGVINVITENDEFEIATMREDSYTTETKLELENFKNYLKGLNNGSYEKFLKELMK